METTPQYYHTILSHTHTLSERLSQLRSQLAEEEKDGGAIQEWTLSNCANVGTFCRDSSKGSTDELAGAYDPKAEAANDSNPVFHVRMRNIVCDVERYEKQRLLEKSGYYPIFASGSTIEEWERSHFASVGAIEERKLSYFASVGTIEKWKLSYCASVGTIEAWKLSYFASVGTSQERKLS